MPEPIHSREGNATVDYKLVLPDKRTIAFDPSYVTFIDAEIKNDVYASGKGLHTFRTLDPVFLDTVKVAMSTANPLLEFRIGFGTPTSKFWLPWQQHIITKYSARFEGIGSAAGHLLIFSTADNLVRLERSNKVLARKGTAAEIVKAIADENNMDSVVEPTDGKFLLYQSFLDDIRFIRSRLLPRAINQVGHGGYYFFIRDNVLHFHTPDYQSTVREMNYYDGFGGELTVDDTSQEPTLWDSGVAGANVVGYDAYTGQSQEISARPDDALRLSDYIYSFDSVPNGARNLFYHLSTNPPVEMNAMAQYSYQRSRQRIFNTRITLSKTIEIRHGDLLNVGIVQNKGASSHSGFYLVTAASHIVKKQAVTSLYALSRGEFRGSAKSLSVQNAQNQLFPETKAPGLFPNILEIQSSESTKGAGKQSSNKTYSFTRNANTGE